MRTINKSAHTKQVSYIYIYISLNDKEKFSLYNLFKILSGFLISFLVSGLHKQATPDDGL